MCEWFNLKSQFTHPAQPRTTHNPTCCPSDFLHITEFGPLTWHRATTTQHASERLRGAGTCWMYEYLYTRRVTHTQTDSMKSCLAQLLAHKIQIIIFHFRRCLWMRANKRTLGHPSIILFASVRSPLPLLRVAGERQNGRREERRKV